MTYMRRRARLTKNSHLFLILLLTAVLCTCCARKPDSGEDPKVTTLGAIEVTARLVEIRGELIDDPLYDYAHVMKYKVLETHRGKLESDIIYVGHYNPAKGRAEVADARVEQIGGNLRKFRVKNLHRMALEVPIDDYYMGGIINKYFQENTGPIYWALWTNRVVK